MQSKNFMHIRISYLLVTAATLLAQAPGLCMADPLGRLFFTPEQRHALDMRRNSDGTLTENNADVPAEEITLNGIVKRSGGKSTVWINQIVQTETDLVSGPKAQPSQARLPNIPVNVPSLKKTINLKVGQTLDTRSGEIREGYQPAAFKQLPSAITSTAPFST